MTRRINAVTVLGSGVMGSRIACHFANIGVKVLLLDIVPDKLTAKESSQGLALSDKAVRNRIVNEALQSCIRSKPAPLYNKSDARLITTGNFEDDLQHIESSDWIIEAVIENLEIKKNLFAKVEQFRREDTLITSNTSGIPVHLMLDGRSENFRRHFCGTHFFNPPRYLRLLEIIPTPETSAEVVDFLMHYGDLYLGKTTVLCKDTPAFIANRIGVYSIMSIFHLMEQLDLSVEEIDALTGPVSGRPKSATFRTCDVVGIDTLVKVANDLYKHCPEDEQRSLFKIPAYVQKLVDQGWLGDKTGQGFYKKTKDEQGKTMIFALDTQAFEYQPKSKVRFSTLESAKPVEHLQERLPLLMKGDDKASAFYRQFLFGLFAYVSHRIPEIAEAVYKVDDALKAGFGWEIGPFEHWDLLGLEKTVAHMEKAGISPAPWVKNMLGSGTTAFYQIKDGRRQYYNIGNAAYEDIPGTDAFIILDHFRSKHVIWKNTGATLFDLREGILGLEFHTKMNTMGGEVLQGIHKAIEIAEKDHRGLVIGNDGQNFSAGANLGMVFMLAIEQEYDEINFAIRYFQQTMMKIKYCSIPVVAAPHHLTLGGGCELCLHTDRVQANAETYIGLVEVGVGLIPAGGGSKEMTARAAESYYTGDPEIPHLQNFFLNIAQAKVATSAAEAFDMQVFLDGRDSVTLNRSRLIADARTAAIALAEAGYTAPREKEQIKVLGRRAMGTFLTGANAFFTAGYISEHDKKIAEKLAYVMCGGDLSDTSYVSEQYLLDLEREAFLSLLGEKKTLERIQSVLQTGKPVRN